MDPDYTEILRKAYRTMSNHMEKLRDEKCPSCPGILDCQLCLGCEISKHFLYDPFTLENQQMKIVKNPLESFYGD